MLSFIGFGLNVLTACHVHKWAAKNPGSGSVLRQCNGAKCTVNFESNHNLLKDIDFFCKWEKFKSVEGIVRYVYVIEIFCKIFKQVV